MSKSQHFLLSYNALFSEKDLYEKIKVLAMKNNRDPIPPRIHIYNNDSSNAILDYGKKVTLKNMEKFNFRDKLSNENSLYVGTLKAITSAEFNQKKADNKTYPEIQISLDTYKCKICNKKLMGTWEQVPIVYEAVSGGLDLVCKQCSKDSLETTSEPVSPKRIAKKITEELDPSYQIRNVIDNYMTYNIYSKKYNLTKDEYINKLENDIRLLNEKYTECMIIVHNITKLIPNYEIPISPNLKPISLSSKYVYILNLGCAKRLITDYAAFKTRPVYTELALSSEKQYILKYGITNDISVKIDKYQKMLGYTIDSFSENVKTIYEKEYSEPFANVCILSLNKFIATKIIHNYQISIPPLSKITKSIILVNEKSIELIKNYIENL